MAAMKTTIAHLSEEDQYVDMRKEIREEFKDLFEPIQNITELPEDVYAGRRLCRY